MIEIGGRPILWHIMKIYSAHGINDFVICCGYKGYVIKEYFANYFLHMSDVTFDMAKNTMEVHQHERRALAGHARRHRRGHDDRRAAASASRDYVSDEEASASPTATASPTSTSRAVDRLSPRARQAGDGHGGAAARPLRRAAHRRRRASTASSRSRAATAAGSTAASSSSRRACIDRIDGDATSLGAASRSSGLAARRRS